MFVQKPVYDDAINAFVERVGQIKLGYGLDESTTMGPLVSKEQQERESVSGDRPG